jgi:catechol 2,3-dioxygenase-like lactoylglutathione lyase family enzyme
VRLLVNLDVDNLERATAFYTRALGLEVGRRFAGSVELLGLASPLYLLERPSGSEPYLGASPRAYTRHWTPVHLDFAVEDLPAARDRAVAAGATLERDIEHAAWGASCELADPFGHGFCLLRFTVAGYDAILETVA